MKAAPEDIHILSVPQHIQPGYNQYCSTLPAFMKATIKKTPQSFDADTFNCEVPDNILLPIPFPNLCVDYDRTPSAETLQILSAIGYSQRSFGKRMTYVVNAKSIDDVRKINKTNPQQTSPTVFQAVNLQALKMLLFVVKVLSAFLVTHCYPAFQDENHLEEVQGYTTESGGIGKKVLSYPYETSIILTSTISVRPTR